MQHSPGPFFSAAYSNSTPPAGGSALSPASQLSPAPPAAAAHKPSPLPPPPLAPHSHRAPSVAAGSTTTRTAAVTGVLLEDPVLEARRTVGLLLGPGGAGPPQGAGGGLLERLEKEVDAVLSRYETAFEPGNRQGPHDGAGLAAMLSTLDALVALLARSSVGGFDPASLASPGQPLSPADVDRASANVQSLFKELQRSREGADLAKAGLSG
ncbi:hypothetical protein JCM1841_000015 [Sporobolomyces salmonicolor]